MSLGEWIEHLLLRLYAPGLNPAPPLKIPLIYPNVIELPMMLGALTTSEAFKDQGWNRGFAVLLRIVSLLGVLQANRALVQICPIHLPPFFLPRQAIKAPNH